MSQNKVVTIKFHGQHLVTAKIGDDIVVAIKPICENIGIDWNAQYQRIKRHPVMKQGMCVIHMPSDGGEQATATIPVKMLNGWLFGVDANRVNEAARPLLIQYQQECFDALYSYWNAGVAINPRIEISPEQQSDLQAIVATISPDGRNKAMIWSRFNRHFKIAKYNQLPAERFEEAKNYLVETFLDGEYIEKDELIDVADKLLSGLTEPLMPYPDEVNQAIEKKSISLAFEVIDTLREHLRRRVAFTSIGGSPRQLNIPRALQAISEGDLAHALTYMYQSKLKATADHAAAMAMMTNDFSQRMRQLAA